MNRTVDPSLKKVATGLLLIYWSIGMMAVSVLFIFAGPMLGPVVSADHIGAIAIGFAGIWIVLLGVSVLIGFVGRILCVYAPEESRAKGFVIAAVILDFASMGLIGFISEIGSLCSLVSPVVFVLFVGRLADYVGSHDLADSARRLLWGGIILLVLIPVSPMLSLTLASMVSSIIPFVVVFALFVLFGVVLVLQYLRLVHSLRLTVIDPNTVVETRPKSRPLIDRNEFTFGLILIGLAMVLVAVAALLVILLSRWWSYLWSI